VQPERFDLTYRDENDLGQRPVVVHVAIYGALERFLAVLIEHTGGAFPFWLHPEQVAIATISPEQAEYAEQLASDLRSAGIRVSVDVSDQNFRAKIKQASRELRAPVVAVIGPAEVEEDRVSVKPRKDQEPLWASEDAPRGNWSRDAFLHYCMALNADPYPPIES
jgi:threonyl-tRNA synthetase